MNELDIFFILLFGVFIGYFIRYVQESIKKYNTKKAEFIKTLNSKQKKLFEELEKLQK